MCKIDVTRAQLERIIRALHAHGDACHREATDHQRAGNFGASEAYRAEQRDATQLARELREKFRDG